VPVAEALPAQVDFYVLPGSEERSRLKLACRLAERGYLAGQRVFVWLDEPALLERFDELLWTFTDRSFVPHELYSEAGQWQDTAVLLSCSAQPHQRFELLVNLGEAIPSAAAHADRIAELVDADEQRRRSGRNRFRQYRDGGRTPETRTLASEDAALS
jgi:DNA polymerase III subunit chi